VRVTIDASGAARMHGTGVAVYIEELARSLASEAPGDEFILYYRFSRIRDRRLFLREPGPNFTTAFPPLSILLTRGVDVSHGPDARLLGQGRARIATVHDVFSLVSDRWADAKFRRKKAYRYAQVARKADLIICDSNSTASDFAELFPVARERLRVVPLGVSPSFHPGAPQESEQVLSRLGVTRPYLLHVGSVARRKNLVRMIEAFDSISGAHPDIRLILAGRLSYGHEEVLKRVSGSESASRVLFPGYVAREDLPALYGAAEALIFPSLYEGFGLPALEAMACGTPVVASSSSSLPEVVGEAGLLFDPGNSRDIAAAIDRVLCDAGLRERLSSAGPARAAEFSWRRTARETLAVYREAAS
jgi:glycosyltransferase involved in cell wall biosynthesis